MAPHMLLRSDVGDRSSRTPLGSSPACCNGDKGISIRDQVTAVPHIHQRPDDWRMSWPIWSFWLVIVSAGGCAR